MKKVLSFVLVLALVLSSFSMAFAATPAATTTATTATTAASAGLSDIAASANGQAIQVANNLGIVTGNPDGTFQPEKAVTRAEFAAMITRALGIPTSALAGYTKVSFKDCAGYTWAVPYLAFCESKGIMLGDGAGNAMPGKTINTNESATMICRALGYHANSSVLVGVWPANYVSLAQDLGIYDDTSAATSVDKQNAAQMIYNALTVVKVQVAADGTTAQLKDAAGANVTMLTAGLNCDNNGYGIVGYDADAVINTIPYVGQYAKTYDNADGNIVAIDDVKSTTIVGTFVDKGTIGTLDLADEFTTDNGDTTYTIDATNYLNKNTDTRTAANSFGQFINGKANATIAFTDGKDYTFNVGLSNKSVQDLYSVEEWTVSAAAKIVAGDLASIADGSFLGYDFSTDKKDAIITKSFELVGANSLSDIKADSVVYVYQDAGRSEISKVSVGKAVVEGKVTKVNVADKEWTVGGKVYAFGLNGNNGSTAFKNELNNDVKLYLDADGDIYKVDVTSGAAKDYAVIVTYDIGGTADGNMKIYKADDSKKTYSTDLDSFSNFEVRIDATANDAADFGRRLIGYSLNKDGEIDGTYPAVDDTASPGGVTWGDNAKDGWYMATAGAVTMPSNTVLKNMTQVFGKTVIATPQNLVVDPDAVVFTYETPTADGTSPVITGISKVANIEKDDTVKLTGQVEALVRDGKVVALIVYDADCSGTTTDSYAVVSGSESAVNPAGDKAYSLNGFIDGKKIASDSAYTSSQYTIAGLETVQAYKLKYNEDKNISKMEAVTGAKVALTAAAITANGYTSDAYLKTGALGAAITAVASDAVFYEVVFKADGTIDEYKIFNGTIYAGMTAWAFETNDDKAGADIVVIDKGNVTTYGPTVTLGLSTFTLTSPAAATTSAVVSGFTAVPNLKDDSGTVNVTLAGSVLTITPLAGATTGNVVLTFTDPTTGETVTKTIALTLAGY